LTLYHNVIHEVDVHAPKERWLHTRISESLEGALKREARRRRQPVSLLVRNVLEGALDLVEDIVETSLAVSQAARGAPRDRPKGGQRSLDDVYGWQELILNRAAECARCGSSLGAGGQAWRGLRDGPGRPVFLCQACVRGLNRKTEHHEEDSR
jgi:hypothetical protein